MDSNVPAHLKTAFHCPHCGVFAHQFWEELWGKSRSTAGLRSVQDGMSAMCGHCHRTSIWIGAQMIFPDADAVPPPNPDLPEEVRADYGEAASILSRSPRGAAALLRLAIQKLCKHLGETDRNIDGCIASLVRKGLLPQVQQALDVVRVIGNEAVHPGELDVRDDQELAASLFELVNLIADQMISAPKQAKAVYDRLPQGKREAIEKRDAKK